jgi:hypothetical protein
MFILNSQQARARNAARGYFDRTQIALASSLPTDSQELIGNAAPVGLDAWRRIDERGAMLQRDILAVYNRLARANTTPVDMGELMSFYPKVSDSGKLSVSMDGRMPGQGDAPVVTFAGTPVPVFTSPATWGFRQNAVMMRGGGLSAADMVAGPQRVVLEALEDMAINGRASVNVAGQTIHGLLTFPDRTEVSAYGAFNLNGGTGANWMTAFSALILGLVGDNSFGQATVFCNYADWTYAGLTDYSAAYPGGTIAQRMQAIQNVREVIPCSKVPANRLIAVNNIDSGEWGSVLSGMAPTVLPKARQNPHDEYGMWAIAASATQFRSDFNGRSHIATVTRS